MKTKYWKKSFDGQLTESDVHRASGAHGAGGVIVKVETAGGKTTVYFAGDQVPSGGTEVSESDLTK